MRGFAAHSSALLAALAVFAGVAPHSGQCAGTNPTKHHSNDSNHTVNGGGDHGTKVADAWKQYVQERRAGKNDTLVCVSLPSPSPSLFPFPSLSLSLSLCVCVCVRARGMCVYAGHDTVVLVGTE